MANLSPEYASNVSSLKAEYSENVKVKKEKKETKSSSSFTNSISNIFSSTPTKEVVVKEKQVPTYSREVSVTKVLNFSDVTNYNTSHKLITVKKVRGKVKKSDIVTQADKLSSKKVLVYVKNDTRYIYFFAN
jgi:hypothetical protein